MSNPPIPPTEADAPERGEPAEMSFFDHLEELRQRLIVSIAAVGIAACVGLYYADKIFDFMSQPILKALRENGMEDKLVFTSPTAPIMLYIELGLLAGLFLALPVVVYELWMFIAPGLYRHERRWALPFIVLSVVLFILGGAFAYKIALPYSLIFLVSMGKSFRALISINEYYDLATVIILWMGVIFELPILIFFLTLFGIVTPQFLLRYFRHAVLGIFIVAAVITPTTDVTTMVIFALPMIGLYLLGVFISFLVVRHKRQAAEAAK